MMRSINLSLYLLLLSTLFVLHACGPSNDPDQEIWLPLFDGGNFADWTPKHTGYELGVNPNDIFRSEDSLLQVRYAPSDTFANGFGHLFYKTPFSYYRLRATYRFTGEQMTGGPAWAFRNNGLMLHCQSPESMAIPQDFPISLELQLLGGDGEGERPTANLCTPGTHVEMTGDSLFTTHCVSSTSPTFHGDQWVSIEALVLGDSLHQYMVGGKVVLEYHHPTIGGGVVNNFDPAVKQDGQPLKEGYIAIQAESHPIDFKSIELLNLCGCMDQKAKNYRSYYLKHVAGDCLY